jgi:hypothetical protein
MGTGGAPPMSTPGGPVFLSFSANTQVLEYQETLVFSAVLTDPDGIDDLIGGTLLDPASGATYGSFQTSAAEGSYQLSVAWAAIDTVISIDTPPIGANRAFRAEFFDQGGNKATQDVSVLLRCSNDTETTYRYGCCAGVREDWNRADGTLGGCGGCPGPTTTCRPPPAWSRDSVDGTCSSFRCEWNTPWSTNRVSCTQQCAAVGATCVEPNPYSLNWGSTTGHVAGPARYGTQYVYLKTCGEVPAAMDTTGAAFTDMSCLCGTAALPTWFDELP